MPTVVIADDSPTLRRIVSTVLTREGYDVLPAEDGISAVQQVFAAQPDVVVLDVQMPRVSGFIAARVLKEDWQTADIPVIMLTSLEAASDRYWAVQAGADRYLTKDFQPQDLLGALGEVLATAAAARGGRAPLRPEPLELTDDDVLSRVCDLLDRKLFETSVAAEVTALAATTRGFEETVAGLLGLLGRFVDYDLAAVLLAEERTAYVAVSHPATQAHYSEFLHAAADTVADSTRAEFSATSLDARVADPDGMLVADADDLPAGAAGARMATYLSMPLRGHGGEVVGVLALSAGTKNAFGETALATLRLIETPAAVVIDNARLAGARTG